MTTSSGKGLIGRYDMEQSYSKVEPDQRTLNTSGMHVPEQSPLLDVLERFADFLGELHDKPRESVVSWECNTDRIAVRSVGRVLTAWKHAGRTDRPPYSLVVRLANQLPKILSQLVEQPKTILKRRREAISLEHIRELDSSCIRWIARQSGTTLAEKAGHRRSLQAVERYQSFNTLENRVVLGLLDLSILRSRDYLRIHGAIFIHHERVVQVRKFLKLCERLRTSSVFANVTMLTSLPQANYVLLHDQRYRLIWQSYLSLVRQQRRRTQLWQYRESYFSHLLFIAVQSLLKSFSKSDVNCKRSLRHDLALLERPTVGEIMDSRSSIPFWSFSNGTEIWIGPKGWCDLPFPVLHSTQEGLVLVKKRNGELTSETLLTDLACEPDELIHQQTVLISLAKAESSNSSTFTTQHATQIPLDLFSKTSALRDWLTNWING